MLYIYTSMVAFKVDHYFLFNTRSLAFNNILKLIDCSKVNNSNRFLPYCSTPILYTHYPLRKLPTTLQYGSLVGVLPFWALGYYLLKVFVAVFLWGARTGLNTDANQLRQKVYWLIV